MVQINLLPETGKKPRRPKVELDIKLWPILFVIGVLTLIIASLWIVLAVRLNGQEKAIGKLNEQYNTELTVIQRLDGLKVNREALMQKVKFLDQQLKREVLWAENLNRLSSLLPPGIWLKKMQLTTKEEGGLERYNKLDLDGSAVVIGRKEMIETIGGFMTAIKNDKVFGGQFSDVQLISSQRTKMGNMELMSFKLICSFR